VVSAKPEPEGLSGRHAQYVGWVASLALGHGIRAVPVCDEDGRYTDRLKVPFIYDHVVVELVVPPPPDDWELTMWLGGT
jgi:hypothetical protein